ncbi:MAG: lamin tail domain-containing protein, partial [Chloroflexota bacterium]
MSHLRLRLCLAVGALLALVGSANAYAAGDVVISQVYGGGGNSGATIKQDYIELHNRTSDSISLAGWSVQYAASGGTSWQKTDLSGSIAGGGYYLIREAQGAGGAVDTPLPDATGTIPMAGGAGKVALLSNATTITAGTTCPTAVVDVVGYGAANCFEGAGPTAGLTNTTAALRASNGCTDTDDNAADFTTGVPAPRNTGSDPSLCGGPPPNQPVSVVCGGTLTTLQGEAATRSITASDPDGTVSSFSATVTPAAAGIAITSQTPAGAAGGTASATVSVSDTVAPGSYTVQVTASNNEGTPQSATCSFTVTVTEIKTIGTVQGSVTGDGLNHRSPFAPPSGNATGQTVFIKGVIYEKTLARTAAGAGQFGFFIQNTAAQADGDPTTSDGIWVFMGGFADILNVVTGQPS